MVPNTFKFEIVSHKNKKTMKLKDIKANDYLYYTERPYSHYADSLVQIRDVDGVLMAHPICTNMNGKYINETDDNWGVDLPISSHFDEKCWFPTHYMGGDPAEWMSKNFPLANAAPGLEEEVK